MKRSGGRSSNLAQIDRVAIVEHRHEPDVARQPLADVGSRGVQAPRFARCEQNRLRFTDAELALEHRLRAALLLDEPDIILMAPASTAQQRDQRHCL